MTVVVVVLFYRLGAVNVNTAKRVIYLDAILYLMGGILGTAHHWYFTGQSSMTMAIGASFSALEVEPLVLLTLDAWDFIRVSEGDIDSGGKRIAISYQWTFYFLMAVGFWNFLGAGVFGFLINIPIVSYFEVGTILTPTTDTRHSWAYSVCSASRCWSLRAAKSSLTKVARVSRNGYGSHSGDLISGSPR